MIDEFPRILMVGQPFNDHSGGGITLSNLFKGWPKEKVAIIASGYMLQKVTPERCDQYYRIGEEEFIWRFPFNLYKEKFASGVIDTARSVDLASSPRKHGLRALIADRIINPVVRYLGINHCMSKIVLSTKIKKWISEFNPQILYLQVSNRDTILFAAKLIDYVNIPSVIHMMDDWPSTISDRSIMRRFWERRINSELKCLLNRIDLHLSICNEMSIEYRKRYGHNFIAFHNTLDLTNWLSFVKTDLTVNKSEIKLLFSGRIGTGIKQSLFELASAIDIVRMNGTNAKLYIQTTSKEEKTIRKLLEFGSVVINPPVDYADLPRLYAEADILIIANDFSPDGIRFLKYSMPTKAPEYMISGTPILIYASSETALFKLFHENNCGHCISKQNSLEIANAIELLINDEPYRKKLSNNAVSYAKENFDSESTRQLFRDLMFPLALKASPKVH